MLTSNNSPLAAYGPSLVLSMGGNTDRLHGEPHVAEDAGIGAKRMVPWSLAQICRHFVRVNTRGVTASDLEIFDYRHRRTPMYPFEPEMNWTPQDDDEYP